MYSFKDYLTVDYTQTGDELLALAAKKRKSDDMEEALTAVQRQKAKANFRKNRAKIALGKKKAEKKMASPEKLKARAQKKAREILLKRMLKDKDKGDLSFAARQGIEKKLDTKKAVISKIAKKLLPQVRKAEKERVTKARGAGAQDAK